MTEAIEALLSETRRFPPPPEFAARARISSTRASTTRPTPTSAAFWQRTRCARSTWFTEPTEVLDDSNPPFYKWFADGELNVSVQLPRPPHRGRRRRQDRATSGSASRARSAITYRELRDEVNRFANALKGARRASAATASRSTCGMVPELPIAMLACARIGAAHSVVFGGFSSTALADRIDDAGVQGARSPPTAAGAGARSCR